MKTETLFGGLLVLTEDGGNCVAQISKDAPIGGGKWAGIIEVEGDAKITFKGMTALQVGEAWVNGELPASAVPIAETIEGLGNAAIQAIE